MISAVETLIPVFAIIMLGLALRRMAVLSEDQWHGVESLVYYVCFPALIIYTLATTDFSSAPVWTMSIAMAGAITFVSAALYLGRGPVARMIGADRPAYTSVFQGATRFNTYVALAIIGALFGPPGISLAAIGIVIMIPLLNIFCVTFLLVHANEKRPDIAAIARGLYTNPLIVACVAGLIINVSGVPVYQPLVEFGNVLGRATLGLGLMCVGASLRIEDGISIGPRVGLSAAARLIGMPAVMAGLCLALGISGMALSVAVICAAVPTAAASVILARKLGGDASLMARIVTIQTLASALTLPLIIAVLPTG